MCFFFLFAISVVFLEGMLGEMPYLTKSHLFSFQSLLINIYLVVLVYTPNPMASHKYTNTRIQKSLSIFDLTLQLSMTREQVKAYVFTYFLLFLW